MSLESKDIQKLARLSRLAIAAGSTEEQNTLVRLNSVFSLIAELESVDLTGVEPFTHPQDMVLRLREDLVTEINQREAIQSVAPATEGGLYLVPKVLE
jgi:aspartyl-tRNA(Asn)/glutamyl-tRNA(Gln) amidotransferase subunit C